MNVKIRIAAGKGGNGARTFLHKPDSFKTPPDGGNGGRGGDIYIQGSHNVSDLSEFRFKKEIEADDGTKGGTRNKYGERCFRTK